MTVTIDKFGRVLIPKPVRDRLGLTAGAELALDVHTAGDGAPALELRAVPDEPALVREGGLLVHTGRLDPAAHDLDAFLAAQRDKRTRRVAGLDADGAFAGRSGGRSSGDRPAPDPAAR